MWKELGAVGLLSLLDAPSSYDHGHAGNGSWNDAFLYPLDTDRAILDAYLTALEHPRFEEDSLSLGGDEGNLSGCSDFGLSEVVVPAGVALLKRESMRTVAVHHLACYLFPVSIEAAWEPDFGRRQTMHRLLLHARLKGEHRVLCSPLASVLAYDPTVAVNERGTIEQQGFNEAEQAHGTGKGVVSHSSPPIQPTREEAAGTCSRQKLRCLRVTTLRSYRRKLLQSYCSVDRSSGAVGDGEDRRLDDVIKWLDDVIQRLFSLVA